MKSKGGGRRRNLFEDFSAEKGRGSSLKAKEAVSLLFREGEEVRSGSWREGECDRSSWLAGKK